MPEEPEEGGFTVVDRRGRGGAPTEPTPLRSPGTPPEPSNPPPASAFAAPAEPDLTSLFLMLASSALVHLGAAPDPMTGAARPNMEQARFIIDLLCLLRDKTEGHRTAEESDLLEEVLYNLQVQFVQAAGGVTRPGEPG